MDKKITIFTLIFIFIFSGAYAYDSGNEKQAGDVTIPPGMELIREGDINIVVPKGGKLRREGGLIFIESSDEYAAREVSTIDKRFNKIESDLAEQKRQIEYLMQAVNKSKPDNP
jgi:hypothetical protein